MHHRDKSLHQSEVKQKTSPGEGHVAPGTHSARARGHVATAGGSWVRSSDSPSLRPSEPPASQGSDSALPLFPSKENSQCSAVIRCESRFKSRVS